MNKQLVCDKLPNHWANVSLSEICIKASKAKRKELEPDSNFLYLDISSIDNITNKITGHNQHNWKEAPSRAQQIIQNEDILFSTVRVYLKNIAKVTNPIYSNQICSSGFTVLRAKKDLCHPNYLFAYTIFEGFLNPLCELQTGTSYPAVRDNDVFAQKIPLPPLPEQRAIVSKIEQLFSELDNGIANLKLAQEQLKVYRQAVLKQAFTGELTRKWREEWTDLPDADELLKAINKEKERYNKENKKRKKSIKKFSEDDILQLQRLPIGWKWVRLGEVTYQIGDVDHKMPKDHPNGIPYVATKDLTDNFKIDFSTTKTISDTDYQELSSKIKPENGDIIFPRYGTIGKNILIDFDKDFLVSYSCAIIKNIAKFMDSKYVYQYLFSPNIKNEIRKYTRETTQANVGIASIETFIFPFCSLPEQQAIVTEIETRLSVCDKLEQDITDSLEKAKALRQSILKQAFEGKLLSEEELTAVRNDPEWEPAEALLSKIKSKTI